MKKLSFLLLVAVLTVSFSGCTHRLVDFTIISSKNIPLEDATGRLKRAPNRVKGKDTSHMVLYFPIGFPNMKEAIDRAIEQYPGAVGLVDGVVKQNSWWAILYGQNSYIVEGTPIYLDTKQEKTNSSSFQENDYLPSGVYKEKQQSSFLLFYHEVKAGETLINIAKQYNVSVADIIKWNKLSSNEIVKDEKLKILISE